MKVRHSRRRACLLALALAALSGGRLDAQDKAATVNAGDALLGEWWTENNEGRIRITREKEGTYRGTSTCCVQRDAQGKPLLDVHNPNPERRARPVLGIVIIWKLKYDADGEYVDGYVYNPRDGKTYRIDVELIDHETLKIRGYLGISLLGQSQIWKRAHLDASGAKPAR
jgi:uncharacterized protein (DUF2147 family)